MKCFHTFLPILLVLGGVGFSASGADYSAFKGQYSVKIKMVVNGASFTGSGKATFAGSGGKGTLKLASEMKGGQGSIFPADTVLKLKSKRSSFSDLTLGFTGTQKYPGKGKSRVGSGRWKFDASSGGLKISGVAATPTNGRGKLSLVVRLSNAALLAPVRYNVESRTVVSNAVTHSYVLARPGSASGPLPLVIGFHGDGGNGSEFRSSLKLEDELRGRAIVAYLDANGGTFEYYTKAGRDAEAAVVTKLIADLNAAGLIRTDRVYMTGISGGATMINAIGFRLGPAVIRGLGIMSGSLYTVDNDLPAQVAGNPTLPPALIIWGQADNSGGTEYATAGLGTRDAYLAAYQCAGTTATAPSPTVIYSGNPANIWWCAVPGMGHAIYAKAPQALWAFFSSRL